MNTLADAANKSLREVTLQLKWLHQFQFSGYYMAIENGYYRDVGLKVNVIERTPNSVPVEQLLSGQVEFAVADAGTLLYRAAGMPVVALAAIFQHSPSILLTNTDMGIQSLNDLKGKAVRLSTGFNNIELETMLNNAGITLDELLRVPIDDPTDNFISGKTKALNAYSTNEPFFFQQQGVALTVFRPRDYGVDFYGDILTTTENLISNEPELVQNFLDASLKGWAYAIEHQEETIEMILTKYNSQHKTRDHLNFEAQESIKLIMPDIVPVGYMHEKRWQHIADILTNRGDLKDGLELSEFIYQPESSTTIWALLQTYGRQITIIFCAVAAIFLVAHIFNLRAQVQLHTKDLQNANLKLQNEARTDSLTGLPNRRHYMEVFSRDVEQARRIKGVLSVIIADIDHFKQVNDSYGHAAGDEALRRVAQVLRNNTRKGDFFARLGGEEFVISCPNTDKPEAMQLAERLRLDLENTEVIFNDQTFSITISLGITSLQDNDDEERLLHRADLALYEAKLEGRNRSVYRV
ncbi:GGDEF domain-containing protein [Maricurvus nonylphenolicus]